MITPEFCVTMARYNRWQNRSHAAAMVGLSPEALWQDRGAFFGSILGTSNHLMWGDLAWLGRLTGADIPAPRGPGATEMTADFAAWRAARETTDATILDWAEGLTPADLEGSVHWSSILLGRDFDTPRALGAMHLFNHGTHHRGQIHAMLTAAGARPDDTDIPFMPEDA